MTDQKPSMNAEELIEAVSKMTPGPWSAHDGQRTFRMPGDSKDQTVCRCGMVTAEHCPVAWTVGSDDEDHTLGEGVSAEQKGLNAAGLVALRNHAVRLLQSLISERDAALARVAELEALIHYPDCWDTAIYPTFNDALREIGCSEHGNAPNVRDAGPTPYSGRTTRRDEG